MVKSRIDKLVAERGLAPSRERAAALVLAGCVLVDDAPASKPGQMVDSNCGIRIRGEDHPYVGRGGVKLAKAIDEFGIDPKDRICMDVGASTGGFTDCLLSRGARRVYAIDVGYGQLSQRLARDPRVVVLDRANIRYLDRSKIPEPIELAVVDVSFISLGLVLPAIDKFLAIGASAVALIKPQFEVGKDLVGKGGIVRDAASHELAIERVKQAAQGLGWKFRGMIESPILGAKGNREFLAWFSANGNS